MRLRLADAAVLAEAWRRRVGLQLPYDADAMPRELRPLFLAETRAAIVRCAYAADEFLCCTDLSASIALLKKEHAEYQAGIKHELAELRRRLAAHLLARFRDASDLLLRNRLELCVGRREDTHAYASRRV